MQCVVGVCHAVAIVARVFWVVSKWLRTGPGETNPSPSLYDMPL